METCKEISIKYYDTEGNEQVRCVAPVSSDALVHLELMQSHYCKISFTTDTPAYIELGDFIETAFGRFEVIDIVKPKENDSIGYSYEVQFDAYYRKWKNKMLKYRPNTGSAEANFTLTNNIGTHAEIILDNLKYYAAQSKSFLYDPKYEGEGTDFIVSVDDSVDKVADKVISYSSSSILDAIANIAETFDCEWWVEGNIIHFGTCENVNEIVDFKDGDNIVSMSCSQSQSTYANRVYAFGAARNLPSDYKEDTSADVTKYGVVEKRLMLPTESECSDENKVLLESNGFELKNGCIQVKGLTEDQLVEGVTTNDDVYPRNLIKTDKITSYEREVEDESTVEEDDYITRTFYRVNDLTIVNADGEKTGDMAFRSSYKLKGKQLHILFQSGSLNGMDFECEFNPDGKPEILRDDKGEAILKDGNEQINPESQVFEVVGNEDYGRFLPDTDAYPKEGDTFVLYNWDSTKLGTTLVVAASNELLAESIEDLKKTMIDPTTYTCTACSRYSYNDGNGKLHGLGDRVNLYNKGYYQESRQSRIIGYEFHLDLPFDSPKYYVGEKPSYSRLNAMESQIEELVYNGQSYVNNSGSGSSVYIVKSYDKVQPTDYNVYSAKAVDTQRLRKDKADTASCHITFKQGLTSDGTVKANQGATFGEYVKSNDYDDATQTGWGIVQRKDGKYSLNVTDLSVWGKAVFNNLTIRELSYVGGNLVFSPAASKIFAVKEVYGKNDETEEQELKGWKCYLLADDGTTATTNSWAVDDQARCETFNIKEGVYENVSNKTYWRRITKVSSENEVITDDDGNVLYDGKKFAWIQMSKIDCMENSDIPAAGDSIVLEGNRTNTDRQSFVLKETWGDDAPREIGYTGINSYSLTDKWVYEVGPKRVRFATQYFAVISRSGDKVYTPNYRGTYSSSFTYYYYDEVTWMGTRWLCVVPEGSSTTTEPSENNEYWKATTAIIATKLELEHDLFSGIAKGETHTVTCKLMLGDTDCTKAVSYWGVTRKTDDSTSDAAWATKDKVKNFSGSIDITWSNDGTEDDIGDGDMATFTFTAKTTTGDIYQQVLSI